MSRGMIPEDLFRIQWGFDACLSPYGRLVACTVTRIRRIDIIANNPIDQKVVELSSSQPYSLVEHSMYRSVFPPQGV